MRTRPRDRVVFPVAESPTTPRMIGRAIYVTPRLALVAGCVLGVVLRRGLAVLVGEQRAREDVISLDRDEILAREVIATIVQAAGLAHPGAVDRVADAASVGETGPFDPSLDVLVER